MSPEEDYKGSTENAVVAFCLPYVGKWREVDVALGLTPREMKMVAFGTTIALLVGLFLVDRVLTVLLFLFDRPVIVLAAIACHYLEKMLMCGYRRMCCCRPHRVSPGNMV